MPRSPGETLTVTCNSEAFRQPLAFWSWRRSIAPTDPQFDWFERVYSCRESDAKANGASHCFFQISTVQGSFPLGRGLRVAIFGLVDATPIVFGTMVSLTPPSPTTTNGAE
jgi:hypothetical protein